MRIPGTRPLRVFEACGRHRSFAKAAVELAITPGAVSQQIKALEEDLGIELFRRKVRGVEFTPQGERYYIDVRRSFDILDDATRRIRHGSNMAEITVSVEASLALNWLVPRLPDFNARYPDVVVSVAARPLPRSESAPYSDIALTYGRRSYSGLRVERLMTEELVPVCAPVYARSMGPFDGREWFRRATLIHDRTFGDNPVLPDWQCWLETTGFQEVAAEGNVSFSSSALCLAFAAAGGGVALARTRIAEALLAGGRLVDATGLSMAAPSAYYVVGSPVLMETAPVRCFAEWLFEAARGPATRPSRAEALYQAAL